LARIPASVIVTSRSPSARSTVQTTQRSGESTYQSQFCASQGPSFARDLGAGVERADQLGRDARSAGDAFHLLDQARLPVRDAHERRVTQAQHPVDAELAGLLEQPQVRPQHDLDLLTEHRAQRGTACAGFELDGVQLCEAGVVHEDGR
jgi:hypothetical protein